MNALDLASEIIRAHEGCRLTAYPDKGGVWTIGWGHTGPDVHQGLSWTQAQADAVLRTDTAAAAERVSSLTSASLSDRQAAALISLTFNIGGHQFAGSTLLARVNARDWIGAAHQFIAWDHVDHAEDKGLLIRRLEEAALFLKGCP